MEPYEAIPRVFLALVLGAIIGLEREFTQKSAGLRTHILVTMGATIFTWVSMSDFYLGLSHLNLAQADISHANRDPSRVASQIVSGIGFIGGGAVLRYGTTVRGLTTAASLWSMASIGMLVGIGQFRLAIIATLTIFLVLFTIGKMERKFFAKVSRQFNRLRIHMTVGQDAIERVQTWVEAHYHDQIVEAKTKADAESSQVEMTYILFQDTDPQNVNRISRRLCQVEGVLTTTVKSYYEQDNNS